MAPCAVERLTYGSVEGLSDGFGPVFDSIFEQSWLRRQIDGSQHWLGEQFRQADKTVGSHRQGELPIDFG
jgi:hypothetical protein